MRIESNRKVPQTNQLSLDVLDMDEVGSMESPNVICFFNSLWGGRGKSLLTGLMAS